MSIDTVSIVSVDTVSIASTDTVSIASIDTVFIASNKKTERSRSVVSIESA